MNEHDFIFRGETLSSHGYMICEFDNRSSASTVTTDSQKEFASIPMFNGKYHPILYHTYGSSLIMEMDICKLEDSDSQLITPEESALIKRWLNSSNSHELRLCDENYSNYFWNGTFNVEEVHYALGCIGFHLTFTSTAPFGYKDKVELSGSVVKNGTIIIDDISDEEGYIYPDITITLKSSGDLRITNDFDRRETVVRRCVSGETLTFTHLLQILSSNGSHELGDDFNYKFIRINNKYDKTVNRLTFSLPCTYSISYNPIAKVVIA